METHIFKVVILLDYEPTRQKCVLDYIFTTRDFIFQYRLVSGEEHSL